MEKWSSPPSYSAILEQDNNNNNEETQFDNSTDDVHLDNQIVVRESDTNQIITNNLTIDIIQADDGLPSYDDACRINNINNNYI